MGSGGLGSEASRPPLLQQQTGSGRRGAGGRAGSVLDTSQLGSWFVVHWWPDKGGDEVLQGVGGTSPNGPGGRPQLESLHTFAARFLPQGVTGRAAAEDTAEAEQAVLELINVLPYPDASGIKGLEELRAVLTSGSVQEHELLPLVQWWQGGLGPCSALGAAHGAAAEHQRQYHEQHQQALGAGNTQQDPANSGAFASLLLLAKAAMEPQPGNGVLQEQSVSATAAAIGQEGEMQPLCEREAAPAAEEGGHEDGARDMDAAVPPSQAMSPVG
ncbi:hypothetical protein HYH02_013276 [Chlamydomonas schloesseri]|uniref:Uncharacterized protein n=1 Tax=Chlamydomonas schloesseri TaxID=2026947 RepID=A0A835VQ00_9CHLO|nr:hypothetical protein HYH02_015324 [Chlamydomonas schloesseri]KAG2431699.1 hypothetical protein HYH02_013276 [Chlamydomonas schloesseri]|eukprot:KAG2423475.1 hypothetical protein HYH02_015324 [Chlamydomonas schloesseri]